MVKKSEFETRGRPRNARHETIASRWHNALFPISPTTASKSVTCTISSRPEYLAFRQSRAYYELHRDVVKAGYSPSLYFKDGKATLEVKRA